MCGSRGPPSSGAPSWASISLLPFNCFTNIFTYYPTNWCSLSLLPFNFFIIILLIQILFFFTISTFLDLEKKFFGSYRKIFLKIFGIEEKKFELSEILKKKFRYKRGLLEKKIHKFLSTQIFFNLLF